MCGATRNGAAEGSAMARHLFSWGPQCQRGGGAAPLLMAWHNGLRRPADWRGKKKVSFLKYFRRKFII
jgi:hypothetical protein